MEKKWENYARCSHTKAYIILIHPGRRSVGRTDIDMSTVLVCLFVVKAERATRALYARCDDGMGIRGHIQRESTSTVRVDFFFVFCGDYSACRRRRAWSMQERVKQRMTCSILTPHILGNSVACCSRKSLLSHLSRHYCITAGKKSPSRLFSTVGQACHARQQTRVSQCGKKLESLIPVNPN